MIRNPLLLVALLVAALAGCASPPAPRTTFLNSVDLVDMTDKMARSFAADPAISRRSPADPPWVISIFRIINHTNQLIPDNQKWLYVGRLRAMLAQSSLSADRSLIWVIPPERWPMVARELNLSAEPHGLRLPPTHQLTAEFHALTTSSARGRADSYLCDYQLLDLSTGLITWEDSYEVKRAVTGLTYD